MSNFIKLTIFELKYLNEEEVSFPIKLYISLNDIKQETIKINSFEDKIKNKTFFFKHITDDLKLEISVIKSTMLFFSSTVSI